MNGIYRKPTANTWWWVIEASPRWEVGPRVLPTLPWGRRGAFSWLWRSNGPHGKGRPGTPGPRTALGRRPATRPGPQLCGLRPLSSPTNRVSPEGPQGSGKECGQAGAPTATAGGAGRRRMGVQATEARWFVKHQWTQIEKAGKTTSCSPG